MSPGRAEAHAEDARSALTRRLARSYLRPDIAPSHRACAVHSRESTSVPSRLSSAAPPLSAEPTGLNPPTPVSGEPGICGGVGTAPPQTQSHELHVEVQRAILATGPANLVADIVNGPRELTSVHHRVIVVLIFQFLIVTVCFFTRITLNVSTTQEIVQRIKSTATSRQVRLKRPPLTPQVVACGLKFSDLPCIHLSAPCLTKEGWGANRYSLATAIQDATVVYMSVSAHVEKL